MKDHSFSGIRRATEVSKRLLNCVSADAAVQHRGLFCELKNAFATRSSNRDSVLVEATQDRSPPFKARDSWALLILPITAGSANARPGFCARLCFSSVRAPHCGWIRWRALHPPRSSPLRYLLAPSMAATIGAGLLLACQIARP